MDRREQNIRVFFDTEDWCRSTEKLRRSIRRSKAGSRIITPEEKLELPEEKPEGGSVVTVTQERSFQAAMRLYSEHPERKIAVLNFASATHPGGGVRAGSSAQEESLCRCSTLYPVLADAGLEEGYYRMHRRLQDTRYTDTCIYSPEIVICKSDSAVPERLPLEQWVKVDVITCAAPNLRPRPETAPDDGMEAAALSDEDLLELHLSRAKRILSVAAANGATALVTGAFGCGAFHNDPEIVASAWKRALEDFKGLFDEVVFAVFTSRRDTRNYDTFSRILTAGAQQ